LLNNVELLHLALNGLFYFRSIPFPFYSFSISFHSYEEHGDQAAQEDSVEGPGSSDAGHGRPQIADLA
jgi:hypothetical protein